MNAILVAITAATLGIEVGWEPLPGGGHEYTIQLEPQLLSVLERGEDEIFSDVPAGIEVRRYRILVGVGKLRRDAGPLEDEPADTAFRGPTAPQETPPADAWPNDQPTPAGPATEQPALAAPATPPPGAFDRYDLEPAEVDEFDAPLAAIPPRPDTADQPSATDPLADSDFDLPAAELPDLATSQPDEPASEPRDPWADLDSDQPHGQAETLIVGEPPADSTAQVPGQLPSTDPSGPIKKTTFDDASEAASAEHDTARPTLDGEPPAQPWLPLVLTAFFLCCSLGGNIYLGWIAADARARYRSVVAKLRGAAA